MISYRGLVPAEKLPNWPMERWEMWAGPSKHFLIFPVRHGTMINYVGFVPTDEEMKESWSAPGDPDKLRQILHKRVHPGRRAREIMSFPVKSVAPEVTLERAELILNRYSINALPVMADGRLLGDGAKANAWKVNYHTSRALMNVSKSLGELAKE